MPLRTEVGLGLGHIVLDRDSAPTPKGAQLSNFRPMCVVAKRLNGSFKMPLGTEVDLGPEHIVFDGYPPKAAQ